MSRKRKEPTESPKKEAPSRHSDKDKGHPRNHKKRRIAKEAAKGPSKKAVRDRKSSPGRSGRRLEENSDSLRTEIVVRIGHGHPEVEPGTYDAAALLESVLAAVQPRVDEGLEALSEATVQKAGNTETAELVQAVRAAGRQIAEALRAGVIEGMRVRERHLAQLAVIDRAAAQARNLSALQARISAEVEHAGLRRVSDLVDLSPFNLAAESSVRPPQAGEQTKYELVTPAYIEADSGRVVEHGWIKVAEAPRLPGGKAHGRVSREHRRRRREEEAEDTTTPSEVEELSISPVPPSGVSDERLSPKRSQPPQVERAPRELEKSDESGQDREPSQRRVTSDRPKHQSPENSRVTPESVSVGAVETDHTEPDRDGTTVQPPPASVPCDPDSSPDPRGRSERKPRRPTAQGTVPITRALSMRITPAKTTQTDDQPPRSGY